MALSNKLRGFDRELGRIGSILEFSHRAVRPAAVVLGGHGAGKTTLLRETAGAAERMGFHVLPILNGWDLRGAPTDHDGEARLEATARTGPPDAPWFVAVDDADRALPGRLRSVVDSVRRMAGTRLAWVFSGRPGADEIVSGCLGVGAGNDVMRIQLADLCQDAVEDIIADILGARPSADLAAFTAQAGGNPGLVKELLIGLRDERRLWFVDGEARLVGQRVPRRVETLVRTRLAALSMRCRQMLQVAAVLGKTLHPAGIALPRESPATILPLVEEATRAGLLVVRERRLAFHSVLIWRVVRQTTPASVRTALELEPGHGRVSVVAAEPEPEPVAVAFAPPTGRSACGWAILSDIERTIAHLVSDGLTNRQIATRVFLSPHTVNYHLRRIFKKLDIVSRVELATLVSTYGNADDVDEPDVMADAM